MILIENAALVDGSRDRPLEGMAILVEGDTIREVSDRPIHAPGADRLDLKGAVVMPGLVDCHVHVIATTVNVGANALLPDALVAHRAARIMGGMLRRGFTTVRDLGGATIGLRLAWEEGLFEGPRLVLCGKALGQTGGHSDFRGRHDTRPMTWFEGRLGSLGRIADGVAECRRAAREELKAGADYIKIMANGGVASPTDPIAYLQYSEEEMRAIVEEAAMAGTYVAAHLYTDDAIARAVRCGVLSLEHCNLIAADTARAAAKAGAMACPTLVTYQALKEEGATLGLPPESVAKIDDVRLAGLRSLEVMREAGLPMAFGTDLLGEMHRRQSEEFAIRAEVLPVPEVIRSATLDAARLLRMEGKIGCIAPGAFADLLVLDGDPLRDLSMLAGQGERIARIMQNGRFVKGGNA
ncbi:metal-dependent hydrolase family protein [Sabulicella glaciei]|uniref:Amidohydrolase family protein n=1 Tax=Sabulicella glaciei TaxID=2984948 RepID=A0ABT3NX58_9PROT|nr:amidohydrolase family protein [Roseococcus sp. MDT2-1-1]MCW8086752.1 amidohydrolase family protein [Roseococcus sp. MDT2-1-1]